MRHRADACRHRASSVYPLEQPETHRQSAGLGSVGFGHSGLARLREGLGKQHEAGHECCAVKTE
jgi:hypothetical protein